MNRLVACCLSVAAGLVGWHGMVRAQMMEEYNEKNVQGPKKEDVFSLP